MHLFQMVPMVMAVLLVTQNPQPTQTVSSNTIEAVDVRGTNFQPALSRISFEPKREMSLIRRRLIGT